MLESKTFNYPIVLTVLAILFSFITMTSTAVTASSINKDAEYKKTHESEYALSTITSVICGISLMLFSAILIWSGISGRNLNIVLGGFGKK
jgi:uncharacterized membrane protein